jgi:hypothetical protein
MSNMISPPIPKRNRSRRTSDSLRYSLLLLLAASVPCWTQTTTPGQANTSGPCSPATTGSNNEFKITCGIGKEQGQKMLVILNKILANQLDPDVVMAKLDEILHAVNPNVPKTIYDCRGNWSTEGPAPNGFHQMTTNFIGADPSLQEMSKLADAGQNKELLKVCASQLESKPEWLTPRLFCGLAYERMGDRPKAKEMLDAYDSRTGPAYSGDNFCRHLSDVAHSELK